MIVVQLHDCINIWQHKLQVIWDILLSLWKVKRVSKMSTQFERESISQLHQCLVSQDYNQVRYTVAFKETDANLKIFLPTLIENILLNQIII